MNIMDLIKSRHYRNQVSAQNLNDLAMILDDRVNLTYFNRPFDEEIDLFAWHLVTNTFKGVEQMVQIDSIGQLLEAEIPDIRLYREGRRKLIKDISDVTQTFLSIAGVNSTRLALKVVHDNACAKFHTDAYRLRLLCTYVGKGTQWVDDRYVNRKKLARGSNDEIIKDPSRIVTASTFEVLILKGESAAMPIGEGIVHRSPPLLTNEESRLLLRLDF